MAKQLNVDLRFNADVSAAKAQLQSLQTSINQLTTSMATQGAQLGITPKIQEAQQAVVQLKTALSQSTNIETGKFDLSKFNSSLKSMNTDLGKLKTQLVNLGPSGQQTFMTLAQSIMTAEIPTKRISASIAALGTTLKNTAKWQLSSSMLHGFMSAVQTSYRYAKDLNTSLNNIRIVTGESAEAMDKFAVRANKAAKALSASTLDYTDAALIFYQQGLQGKEVEERAEITLKMANVSRQSAEVVSDQLTAVWNNFANGTDSLESFADKMVALGAATASSSDEIAGGLEKFAAVGETIGLSFDYAAAALATITSNTRQSEEVVGTALKTIFARIQGLKLGDTLEDGTTLNKYSQALETVGVHIYNANGGLKNMDTILDETAAKWNTLTGDQQAALAQTVAGVRQYNQFIALMDNWESKGVGDKDSMKANLETINESTGALQEQADIYAESWEAASKRVKASAEEIYMDLLDDDFFIDLTNGLADFLGLLDNLLDSMGGARGLLTGLSSILLNMFAGSAAKGLENMVYNFRSFVGLTQKEAMGIQTQTAALVRGIVSSGSGGQPINNQQTAYLVGMESQVELQHTLLGMKDKLSEQEQVTAKAIIEQNAAYAHQVELLGQAADKAKEKTQSARDNVTNVLDDIYLNNDNQASEDWRASIDTDAVTGNMKRIYDTSYKVVNEDLSVAKQQAQNINVNDQDAKAQLGPAIKQYAEALNKAAAEIESIDGETELSAALKKKAEELNRVADKPTGVSEQRKTLKEIQQENSVFDTKAKMQVDSSVKTYGKNHLGIGSSAVTGGDAEAAVKAQESINKSVDGVVKSFKEEKKAAESAGKGIKNLKENTKESEKQIKGLGNTTKKWSQTMVGMAQSAMSLSFAISSLNSLKTTWADETIGAGEKLLQTFMSLGMAIPMLINGINGLKTAYMSSATVQGALNLVTQTRIGLQQQDIATMTAEELHQKTKIGLEQAQIAITNAKIVQKTQELATTGANIAAMTAEELAEKTGMTTKQAGVIISALKNKANLTEALSEAGLAGSKTAGAIATKIATVANWGFLASMTPLLAITLVLVAAIAALALIIWGLTAAFKAIADNSPEGKLKAAREESAQLSEQLNQTKQAAEDLKAGFNEYDEITKKLSECTKGTKEWTEALKNNNDKVLELMDKYPELINLKDEATGETAIGIGKDGQLIIADWAIKELTMQYNDRVATATIADSFGKQKLRNQEIENLQTKKEDLSTMTVYDSEIENTASRIVKKLIQQYGQELQGVGLEEINKVAEDMENVYEQDKKQALELIGVEQQLITAIRENTIATQLENAASAGELLADDQNYQNSEYKDIINAVVGANGFDQDSIVLDTTSGNSISTNGGNKEFVTDETGTAKEKLIAGYKDALVDVNNGTFGFIGGHVSSDQARNTFKEYTDYKNLDQSLMSDINYTNEGVEYYAIDPETNEVSSTKTKLDYDTIATTLASRDMKEEAKSYGEAISEQMSTFKTRDEAEIFGAAATGNSGLLSEELLEKNEGQIEDIINKMKISDKTLEKMGFTAEDYGGNIDEAREAFKKQEKEIVKQEKAYRELKIDGVATLTAIASKAEGSAEKIAGFSSSLGKSLGIENMGELSQEFIAENEGLIKDYLNGVEGKAEELRKKITQNVAKIQLGIDTDSIKTELNGKMITLSDWIANFPIEDLKVGASLDDTEYYAALQNMIDSGQITVDEANKILDGLGFEPEVTYLEVPMDETSYDESTSTYTYTDPVTGEQKQAKVESKLEADQNGMLKIPVINGSKTKFRGTPSTFANSIGKNNKDSSGNIDPNGDGSGSNKPKVVQKKAPIKEKKAKDEIERYHEITQAIEDQTRVLDRLSKIKDKAYGVNKLKAIDKEIEALKQLNKLDQQHLNQIRQKLALDKQTAAGYGVTFDEYGRINNYESIIQAKMDQWKIDQDKIQQEEYDYEEKKNKDENYDADGSIKLGIDQRKEKIDENYEEFKDSISQYEETFNLFEDTVDKIQDQFDQLEEKIIEKIVIKAENKIKFNEFTLDLLDFQISLLGEKFDVFSETIAYTAQKFDVLDSNIKTHSDRLGELWTEYELGGIKLDSFLAQMEEINPDILSVMEEALSVDAEMMEYYSKAFDAARDKFSDFMTLIDQGISKLDHFKNMLSLVGKENDNKMIDAVLQAQYTSASHKLQASSDWYDTTKKEYEALYARWVEETNKTGADRLGEKGMEMLENELKVAREKMNEADEERLSDLEAVGEKAQEILQNNLDMARKKLEENLVGSSLEDYMTDLDRLSKKQEEYLTNTNKMYETNKLIRQAQLDMDKTENNRAKQQYNDYVKYIEQLQQSGKLSQYELSVAQAKYELLQAQIALEEAQDAKNQVRLTRDSEGNYGYVYTANEDKVSGAEQAVADAENKLYNIGLDGAKDYENKKAQILQEAIETFTSIEEQYQTGQIASEEEFNQKMTEAKNYYYERLKEYDGLYYMALGTMQEESYGNTIDYELSSVDIFDTFATSVGGYLNEVNGYFTDYDNKVQVVKDEVGNNLATLRDRTKEVTDKTFDLTKKIEDLTTEFDNELSAVRLSTGVWGEHRDILYENIRANTELIGQLREIQKLQMGEVEDYSLYIKDLVERGQGADNRLVQQALSMRWDKMKGEDTYDYQQMKNDYVLQYSKEHGISLEQAEAALQDDAWYKTLDILRNYKIERTDWSQYGDQEWAQQLREEKLSKDWEAKIRQYVGWNPGVTLDDPYLLEMLNIRKVKIEGLADKTGIKSNEELLNELGVNTIDTRKEIKDIAFDTGGYTGNWGPEGKFAMLHEKELVLNKQDTENFLTATAILREISQMLDNNALIASLGAINLKAIGVNTSADQILQQEITIHADFPNVTDHSEIEIAIDNLINAASQHAYKV